MPYIRMPEHVDLHIDAQEQWLTLIYQAEQLLHEDGELQAKAKLGLRLKDRKLPSEVLGRNYVQYCNLINKMYDAYLKNVQLQRAGYMMEVISVLMMRLFELRNELVHLIVNDYIYVDSALTQLRMTPYDIQIIVPHHIPLEARPEVMETLFEKMSAESTRRLRRPPKKPQPKPPPSPAPVAKSTIFEEQDMGLDELEQPRPPPPPPPEPVKMEEEEEEEITPIPSVHTVIPEEFIQSNIIQTMERYRQFYTRAYEADCNNRRLFFAPKIQPAPLDFKNKAARLIQDIYRKHMTLKRKYAEDIKRDIILGILPDREKKYLNLREETVKLYNLRRKKREKVTVPYKMDYERETLRLLRVDKDNHIEDITEEIREWFMEWYFGYGFFPQYPLETEGGTILVVTGQYPTIDEKQEEDEAFKQKTKGKTKDQLKEERKQAAFDKAIKAEQERDKQKNIALAMFKARCNPFGDPGYEPKASEHMDKIVAALTRYRQAWSIYDQLPLKKCKEVIYGYMMPLVTEDIVQDMHLECRKLVDEMMRLELKLFVKAQQAMFKRMNWKYPKFRPRKRPKIAPVQIPFVIDDKVLKNIEAIFDSCIMSRPKNKIEEVLGDLNFAAANLNVQDPDVRYPSPGYGDVRRRLILSCVFGCVEPLAPQNKSVLLLGPRKNGKSFLADVVAGEMNAIKFDISPEAFSSKVPKPGRLLRLVFVAARVFQPAVIFCKDIERVFYKKVPPADRKLRPTAIKRPLVKEVKAMKSTDKVIFIGTCSDPFVAKARPMVNIFTEVLLVPIADYGTLQMFFANKLQSIRSMPKDYVVQPLAKLFDGFGFGVAMDLLNKVLTPERIIRLNVTPLSPTEFLEYMIENEMVPLTREEYQKYIDFVLKHSKLYKERMEYDLINWTRKQVYDKIAKKEAAKAAKAEAAKAAQAENKG